MTVADGSQVRLAYVAEATIGTTPATPSFKTQRYVTADLQVDKQTDQPDEVRADGNRTAPVDVGRSVTGTVNCLLSYGTYDDWLSALFRKAWASDVLINGVAHQTFTVEEFYELGTTDNFLGYQGVRINTLDLDMTAKQSVKANWGLLGLRGTAVRTAIISGATYAAATTTEVFNSALNVADLTFTGISNAPVIQKMALKINSNCYPNEVVGQYDTYSHGLGPFDVDGSISAFFENKDTYEAILNHTTVGLAWTLEDAAGNSYLCEIPANKFMKGAPAKPGNGKGVMMDVPFKSFYDSGIGATMKITRTAA